MTGRCAHCHYKTMALPGSMNRNARALPPPGFRLGWVIEDASSARLVCSECVRHTLLLAA